MHRRGLATFVAGALASALLACGSPSRESASFVGGNRTSGSLHTANAGPRAIGAIAPAIANATPWVLGYYAGYEAGDYPVDAIDWSGLTHVVVAFYLPDYGGNLDESIFQGPDAGPALAHALVDAAHAHGRRAIASVGGAGMHDPLASSASDDNRGALVANIARIVSTYAYDGVDLDWEPFGPGDAPALLALARDLKSAIPGITLTIPVGFVNANTGADLSAFAEIGSVFDRVNLMTYGMAGAYDGWRSWHSAPLFWNGDPSTPVGIDQSTRAYLDAGVPAGKLGIGSGFYGQCYGAPVRGPMQDLGGTGILADDSRMSFAHIMDTYDFPGAKQWDDGAKVPFFAFADPQGPEGCSYISFEDERAIAEKGAWAKSMGLGGAILWTINQGYRPNADEKNPLLAATRAAFLQ
jgi:chitinase